MVKKGHFWSKKRSFLVKTGQFGSKMVISSKTVSFLVKKGHFISKKLFWGIKKENLWEKNFVSTKFRWKKKLDQKKFYKKNVKKNKI